MLQEKWASLKNGSDIRGTAMGGENGQGTLTNETLEKIADAFALWLGEKTGKTALRVAVGHDSRLSAGRIRDVVLQTLQKRGVTCLDCGLISTPAMFMTCIAPPALCDGSVQITASHLPADRNGLKFFTKAGGCEGSDIESILSLAQDGACLPEAEGRVEKCDFLTEYTDLLTRKVREAVNDEEDFDHPLRGFKIAVDAGNGAGGFYATRVLEPLGADVSGSQFLEPDGRFPNHIPNPENADAMASISAAVLASGADMGLIFDTDVDRAGAVDSHGREINRNRLIALISAILLEERTPAVIVTDSVTSDGLAKFITNHGGMHRRFKRGYKNVINEAIRLNREGQYCPLAIETSGHAALKENYFLDDGAYLVTKLLIKAAQLRKDGKKLENLLIGLDEPAESREARLKNNAPDTRAYGEAVIKAVTAFAQSEDGWSLAPDNCEGVRVSFAPGEGDGWFLLRLSLHEPLLPLNIESNVVGGVRVIARKLYPLLYNFDQLDLTTLKALMQE